MNDKESPDGVVDHEDIEIDPEKGSGAEGEEEEEPASLSGTNLVGAEEGKDEEDEEEKDEEEME